MSDSIRSIAFEHRYTYLVYGVHTIGRKMVEFHISLFSFKLSISLNFTDTSIQTNVIINGQLVAVPYSIAAMYCRQPCRKFKFQVQCKRLRTNYLIYLMYYGRIPEKIPSDQRVKQSRQSTCLSCLK